MASRCYGFDDLFRAAHRRDMTGAEREQFGALAQPERNDAVRELAALTHGAFECDDRVGNDGVTYTAFSRLTDPPDGLGAEELIRRRVTLACLDLMDGKLVLVGMRKDQRNGSRVLVADYSGGIVAKVFLYESAAKPMRGEVFHRETPEISLPLATSEISRILASG